MSIFITQLVMTSPKYEGEPQTLMCCAPTEFEFNLIDLLIHTVIQLLSYPNFPLNMNHRTILQRSTASSTPHTSLPASAI